MPQRSYVRVEQNAQKDQRFRDAEIDPATCVLFILIVFLIIPFTLLSPFRYPQPSALDRAILLRGEPSESALTRAGVRAVDLGPADLSALAAAESEKSIR